MQREDIERYLTMLGEVLEELGVQNTIRLLMIGGGYMLTQIGNRELTRDVDVLVRDIPDRERSEDYSILSNAVRVVADDAGIDDDWMSDNMGEFLASVGKVPNGKLWRKFGRRLEVYVPPEDFMLANKILAGREKDLDDARALMLDLNIKTRKQVQKVVDKYIKRKDVQDIHGVPLALDRLFPDG